VPTEKSVATVAPAASVAMRSRERQLAAQRTELKNASTKGARLMRAHLFTRFWPAC